MPRFPFRRSPADDLRDLYKVDRIKTQTRSLGHSSISPGDGVLEVRSAGGTILAGLGHAGGKSGLLVPAPGGGWMTAEEYAQARAQAAREDAFAEAAAQAAAALAAAQADATAKANAAIAAAAADATSKANGAAATAATDATAKANAAKAYADALTAALPGLVSAMNAALGGFGSLAERLNSHASRLGAVENQTNIHANSITNMSVNITSILQNYATQQWVRDNFPYIGP